VANKKPLLSVIITTYSKDRLADVFDLLSSLGGQTYPHIEVLFVGEQTPELCQQVREHAEQQGMANVITLFNGGEPGLSAARNLALAHAKGEIIGFLDDDVLLFPEWAEETVKTFDDSSFVGATGPALPLWEDSRMHWLPEEFYWLISCTAWTGWQEMTEARSAWGANMSFRREAFDVAGLFLNTLGYHKPMAEDLEFSLRVKARTGKRILFNPYIRVWHRVRGYRLTWKFITARAHHIGQSRRLLKKLYPQSPELFALEKGLSRRIVGLLLNMPREFFRSPGTAWRRLFLITLTSLAAGWGYLRPGASLEIFQEGQRAEGGRR
jgi:GT2 family glycosyltransferase